MPEEPLILSIDTSDRVLGVDLSAHGELLRRRVVDEPRIHASMLIPTVCELLEESCRSMRDLSSVAVAMGPGSYTGLRIGVSTAKGLSFALAIPLVGVPTMDAMAVGLTDAARGSALITCLSSRRGEVYAQVWEIAARPVPLTPVEALSLDDARQFLVSTGRIDFLVTGSGARALLESTSGDDMLSVHGASPGDAHPTVHGVAVLALERFQAGRFEDVASFEPAYLKDFIAKRGASPFAAARNR